MYREIFRILKTSGKIFTALLGKNCQGYGDGDEVEPDSYKNIRFGNMQGRGLIHFYDNDRLTQMLSLAGFDDVVIDSDLYTDNGDKVEFILGKAYKSQG